MTRKPTKVAKKAAPKRAVAKSAKPRKAMKPLTTRPGEPALLSGGNPQIAKGYGEEPIKAYIAAMPGWQKGVGRRLDAIITRAIPGVRKAVKWNSPFYGLKDDLWFVSFHVFAKYVKVTFFKGASLKPPPAGKSKYPAVRYYDIHEGELDEAQFTDWVKQASTLPGEKM
jgi:hypothetical protein